MTRPRRNASASLLVPIIVLASAPGAWTTERAQRAASPTVAQDPRTLTAQAIDAFEHNRVREAAEAFDRLVAAAPTLMPHLWQRGIALYYVGRFRDCRLQFEAHRTVNPADVENAAWHFLCAARETSPEQAKASLLPVGSDARLPMRQIYDMFKGTTTPAAVLAAGAASLGAQFFAHLYVGLYYEATGDTARALQHITTAADERFAATGGYMHMVARVHLAQRANGSRP